MDHEKTKSLPRAVCAIPWSLREESIPLFDIIGCLEYYGPNTGIYGVVASKETWINLMESKEAKLARKALKVPALETLQENVLFLFNVCRIRLNRVAILDSIDRRVYFIRQDGEPVAFLEVA